MTSYSFITLAQTPVPTTPPPKPSEGFGMLMWMVFAFVLVYFLTIRPQRKKQLELEQQVKALKTGDRVITASGIHGRIANVGSDTASSLTLEIADKVKIEIEKSAIATIVRDK